MMKYPKLEEGDVVYLLEYTPPKRAQVMALLSVQFTALWLDASDTMSFLFYRDYNDTWRM